MDPATIAAWIPDPAFTVGPIEDFGNVNFNMHVNADGYLGNTVTLRVTSAAGDDSAGTPWNDMLPWTSDVAITSLKINKMVTAGRSVPVKVTVKNNGPDEVVTGEVFLKAVTADGTVGARFTGVLNNLRAGRKTTLSFSWTVPATPQTVTWEASVEAFAAFDPDETDNEAMATTTVK